MEQFSLKKKIVNSKRKYHAHQMLLHFLAEMNWQRETNNQLCANYTNKPQLIVQPATVLDERTYDTFILNR